MAIKKDPKLIKDFNVDYEEVQTLILYNQLDAYIICSDIVQDDIYDVVADVKLLRDTDKVTGKQRIAPRQKISLFIPGRIIHITQQKPIRRYYSITDSYL